MNRRIVGFHQDDPAQWVATTSARGRRERIGTVLPCRACAEGLLPGIVRDE